MAQGFCRLLHASCERLGDRITDWMTINEIYCFTYMGYGVNQIPPHAPGTVVKSRQEVLQTVHHALLAHGSAASHPRRHAQARAVSLVVNYDAFVPVIETRRISKPPNAHSSPRNTTAPCSSPRSPVNTIRWSSKSSAPTAQDSRGRHEDHRPAAGCSGYNIYTGSYVRAADNARGYEILPLPREYPKMNMPWLNFVPESIYWGVRMITDALGKKNLPIVISENGCATEDDVTASGEVFDLSRVMYVRSYLRNAHRAVAEGYPLKGYFHWSLMDNFEWAWATTRRSA